MNSFGTDVASPPVVTTPKQPKSFNYPKDEKSYRCSALVEYRDTLLVKRLSKAFIDYSIVPSVNEDMRKLRSEIINNRGILKFSKYADPVISGLQAWADVISGLVPLGNIAKTTAKRGAASVYRLSQVFKRHQRLTTGSLDKITKNLAEDTAKTFLSTVNPLSSAAVGIFDATQTLISLGRRHKDREITFETLKFQINDIDKKIALYQSKIESSPIRIKAVNEFRQAVDSYCA